MQDQWLTGYHAEQLSWQTSRIVPSWDDCFHIFSGIFTVRLHGLLGYPVFQKTARHRKLIWNLFFHWLHSMTWKSKISSSARRQISRPPNILHLMIPRGDCSKGSRYGQQVF